MKATSNSTRAESPTEGKSNLTESDEERWDDKLVIDLDSSNNMSNTESKAPAKAASTSSDTADSDTPTTKTKEQPSTTGSKIGRAESAPPGKPKGKRNGQKKGNENSKAEVSTNIKLVGKAAKTDKEKSVAGKPGRKKKEKQSPMTVKSEPTESLAEDPYKFEPSDDKIAGTATGKSSGKAKVGKDICLISKD